MSKKEDKTKDAPHSSPGEPIGRCNHCGHPYHRTGPRHYENCRYWIDSEEYQNCTFVAIEENGPMTLREVAEIMGISHVGVKFIEQRAIEKLTKKAKNNEKFEINIDLLRD